MIFGTTARHPLAFFSRLVFLCCLVNPAWAAVISLDYVGPSNPLIGDTFAYQLRLSGLDPNRSENELLGGFQVEMAFNSTVINFERVQFSGLLGDPDMFEAIEFVGPTASGSLLFGSVSLLDSLLLADLQRTPGEDTFLDSLLLAAVVFSGAQKGISPIDLSNAVFSDALGTPIPSTPRVIQQSVKVPEPSMALLLLSGFAAFLVRNPKNRR